MPWPLNSTPFQTHFPLAALFNGTGSELNLLLQSVDML